MKNTIFLLLLFSPFLAIAKKGLKPNPCDSMNGVVVVNQDLLAKKIATNIEAAVRSYSLRKDEKLEIQKIDDSTLVGTGIMVMMKTNNVQTSEVYGSYKVASNADGKISYKVFINCKQGKFKYEFTDLLHFDARYTYGELCIDFENSFVQKEINGLRVTFLYRIEDIVELMKKVNEKSVW